MKQFASLLRLPEGINPQWRIGIVHALYYQDVVAAMVQTAQAALLEAGIRQSCIRIFPVFGSSEVPLIGAVLAREKVVDALIGLGVIVEGKTKHAQHLAREVARGIMDVQIQNGLPFAYGVLHVTDIAQAQARAEKGRECALAVLHSLAQLKRLQS